VVWWSKRKHFRRRIFIFMLMEHIVKELCFLSRESVRNESCCWVAMLVVNVWWNGRYELLCECE
jgi:hypothetical protein